MYICTRKSKQYQLNAYFNFKCLDRLTGQPYIKIATSSSYVKNVYQQCLLITIAKRSVKLCIPHLYWLFFNCLRLVKMSRIAQSKKERVEHLQLHDQRQFFCKLCYLE